MRRDQLLDTFCPQANAYYQFALLTRYLPKYSSVLATRVEGPFLPVDRKLVAAALRTHNGNHTLLLVNESSRAANVSIELDGLAAAVQLNRYALARDSENKSVVDLRAGRSFTVQKQLADLVPPMSIVAYSSYNLASDAPGLIAE